MSSLKVSVAEAVRGTVAKYGSEDRAHAIAAAKPQFYRLRIKVFPKTTFTGIKRWLIFLALPLTGSFTMAYTAEDVYSAGAR